MVWLHSHQIRLQSATRCISSNPGIFNGLAAFTQYKASRINRMQVVKPHKFLCLGCILAKSSVSHKHDASHHLMWIPTVRLQSHLIKLQSETWCISSIPMCFYVWSAITPGKATITNRMHRIKPWNSEGFACIHTRLGYNNEQDASHQSMWILIVWLHSHQIRLQFETWCISSNPGNSYGVAALTPGKATIMNRMHIIRP